MLHTKEKAPTDDTSYARRLLGTILTVYIPTVLLLIISHMTNYFKPFFFEVSSYLIL